MNSSTTTATCIDDTQFMILCDCKKGFHIFGNGKDKFSNRIEHRCMAGHMCEYESYTITIDDTTERVDTLPRMKRKYRRR
eukprot:SAG31_NODE_1465_length_8232_cov_31.250830_9_plen_80_part_00